MSEVETSPPTDAPVLYSFRRCPYAMRARMALRISGQRVRLREVVLRDKPAHMLALSPKGTVPVLWQTNGDVLEESLDIMQWALAQGDPAGWLPRDGSARSEADALITQNDGDFKTHLDRYKYANRYEDVDPLAHRREAEAFLQILEERLRDAEALVAGRWGYADAAILPFVRQFANADRAWFDAAPYPQLQAWLAKGLADPVFCGVMPKYAPWASGDPPVYFPADTPVA